MVTVLATSGMIPPFISFYSRHLLIAVAVVGIGSEATSELLRKEGRRLHDSHFVDAGRLAMWAAGPETVVELAGVAVPPWEDAEATDEVASTGDEESGESERAPRGLRLRWSERHTATNLA